MSTPFLVHASHQAYLDGRAPYPNYMPNNFMVGCILLFFLPFLGLVIYGIASGWTLYQAHLALEQHAEISAMVTEKWTDERFSLVGGGSTHYYIRYSYGVDGQSYLDEQGVSAEAYEDYRVGRMIQIDYALGDPSITRLAGADLQMRAILSIVFSFVFLLIGGAACYFLLRRPVRWVLLRKEAQVIKGHILAIIPYLDGDSDFHLSITASFVSPMTHQTITETRSSMTNHHKKTDLSTVGDQVLIYYLRDDLWEIL